MWDLCRRTGAGGLTRAFLELPNVKKVITIEDAFRYHPHLLVRPSIDLSNRRTSSLTRKGIGSVQALKEESDAENPGRMELVEMDSFTWEAYTEAAKHIQDVPTVPWEERESSFFRSSNLVPEADAVEIRSDSE